MWKTVVQRSKTVKLYHEGTVQNTIEIFKWHDFQGVNLFYTNDKRKTAIIKD